MIMLGAFVAGCVIGASLMLVWALVSGARDVERMYDDWLP